MAGAADEFRGMALRHPFFVAPSLAGFTLTELVVVIAIVAIVSVFAAARFTRGGFDTRAVFDQLFAQVTYARKTAVAQRRQVCVHVTAAQSQLFFGTPASCPGTSGVPSPVGATPFTVNAGSGMSFGPVTTFQFDGQGRYLTNAGADPGAKLLLSVTGDGTFSLCVERETGYAYPVASVCPP